MSNWRKPRPQRTVLKKGLILCEGETEENYFKGLISDPEYRRRFASIGVEIYKPQNHSPRGLLQEAKERMKKAKRAQNPYDFVWIVFDKDGHQNIAQTFHEAGAARPPINIAFTSVCFEYFILLHFRKTTKAFNDCDSLMKELRKHLPEYEKAGNLFALLREKMAIGLANSEWCHAQCEQHIEAGSAIHELSSFSNVHLLINYLFDLIK